MYRFYIISPILFLLLLSALSCSTSHESKYRFEEGVAWNTVYHITYEADCNLGDSILLILEEIDNSLSPFNPESTVSRINDNRDSVADRHFETVYNESRLVHNFSDGAFDPTLAPIIRAWGFGQGHKTTTDTLRLDSLMHLVGITRTELNDGRLVKENPDIEFNFSALAKGYGVDCVAEMLKRNGVTNFLVEIGGEIRASGLNPQGKPWRIGIDRPEAAAAPGEIIEFLTVSDASVATSGNYRNYQESGSERFGHTVSPKTGRPIQTDVISATVIAPTCMEADALATCCMVLGSEEALNLCTRLRFGVLLILDDMSSVSNPAFRSFLQE